MDVTESNPLLPAHALAGRDADMHLTPGRGIWCLSQSNTYTGHDIPSGPATRLSTTTADASG